MPAGCFRPSQRKHPLGRVLSAYTCKSHSSYDPEFNKLVREQYPSWFIRSSDVKKKLLLSMEAGSPRPPSRSPLGRSLSNYILKSSISFDAEFAKEIRQKQAGWFRTNIDPVGKKKQLLAMPIGCQRPSKRRHPLGRSLCFYTEKSQKTSYDPVFDRQIRSRQIGWW